MDEKSVNHKTVSSTESSRKLQGYGVSRSVGTPTLGQDEFLRRTEQQLERVGERELRGILHTIRSPATIQATSI